MSIALYVKTAASIFIVAASSAAFSVSLDALSDQDANAGLKAALEKGSAAAVGKLGIENGFLNNEKVKIQLPSILEQARPLLKMTGRGQQLDDLVLSMNRAAEAAVPQAKPLLINAVKSMSVSDVKNILTGGDTAITDFFKSKTSDQLQQKFLPVVKKVTDRTGLAAQYNGVMGQGSKFGAVSGAEASVEGYVTQRALDGLYLMIAEEEKSIRQNPMAAGSQIIGKVFGALK